MAQTFECTLVTPESEVLDKDCTYVSFPAWDGQVGIEPNRAPLLMKLGDGSLRIDYAEGGSAWFFVGGGFAQMKDNHLTLLTDEAIEAHSIVKADAEAELKEALGQVAVGDVAMERRDRAENRARALIHLAETQAGKI